jgi:hypothetical protein
LGTGVDPGKVDFQLPQLDMPPLDLGPPRIQ